MRERVKVSTPGKLFLSGEHSVVYGEPALVTAIDLHCQIEVVQKKGDVISIESKELTTIRRLSFDEVIEFTRRSRALWEKFSKTKDRKFLMEITRDPLSSVLTAVGETFQFIDPGQGGGLDIRIVSSIPPGSGLGSSAAVTVGILKGIFEVFDENIDMERLNDLAYEVEKRQHGFPSGADNSIIVFGGFLQFQRVNDKFQIREINAPHQNLPEFLLIQTGRPEESTGEMVSMVREQYDRDTKKMGSVLESVGGVTVEFVKRLETGEFDEFSRLIRMNQGLLEKLGVVGEKTKQLIKKIEDIGGVAKVCGAGGVRDASGVLLCLHEEPERLTRFAKENNLAFYFPINLGVKGVTWTRV